ncbi:alpha-2,3-sialyltransferase [Helicobacter sp. 23-1045]
MLRKGGGSFYYKSPPRSDSQNLPHHSQNLPHHSQNLLTNFAIFRCNQFYFERKYYLGKRVDFAFVVPNYLLENHFTHSVLKFRGEYEIGRTIATTIGFKSPDRFYCDHSHIFPYIKSGEAYLAKLEAFYHFMKFNELHYNARPTSGIYMCAVAVALGFREIYIAGIDLYQSSATYAFECKTPNVLKKDPNFGPVGDMHSLEIDLEALEFLAKNYGVKFYSICPNSPISKYISLPKAQNKVSFVVESKPTNYTKDIIIPSEIAYQKLSYERECAQWGYTSPYAPSQNELPCKKVLRENIAFCFLKDLWRLPKHIFDYLQEKRAVKLGGGGEIPFGEK